ncbi:MAG: hypothetical protein AAF726_07630 [Planctomycetota bacterium]
MNRDPIESLLREADANAPTRQIAPLRASELEQLRRRQLARRGAALALVALPVLALAWDTSLGVHRDPVISTSPSEELARSLQELDDTLASLRARPAPPSAASDSAAAHTFRALHRGAARGDESSVEGLRWLADRFPETHGGRCARLFLDTKDEARSTPSATPIDSKTK